MVIGLGQVKGLFKPAPGLNFPMQAVAVGKCVTMWGLRKQSSKARLEAKFVLPGLGCSLS